jgi:predicted RecB family nuclease
LEQEGILYDQDMTLGRITTMLRKRLENKRVADWFSNRWTTYNECAILSTNEQGDIVERRPDRVMTDGKQWVVIDFKFGRPRDDYHNQVREYMHLLNSMGHKDLHGYLWYVYSNKIEEVTV